EAAAAEPAPRALTAGPGPGTFHGLRCFTGNIAGPDVGAGKAGAGQCFTGNGGYSSHEPHGPAASNPRVGLCPQMSSAVRGRCFTGNLAKRSLVSRETPAFVRSPGIEYGRLLVRSFSLHVEHSLPRVP